MRCRLGSQDLSLPEILFDRGTLDLADAADERFAVESVLEVTIVVERMSEIEPRFPASAPKGMCEFPRATRRSG